MELLGLPFIVEPPHLDERAREGESAPQLVERLAKEKALLIAERHQEGIVIGADTVVALGESIWSKPSSDAEARTMLQSLSGKVSDVYTGLALVDASSKAILSRALHARVRMKKFSDTLIDRYLATDEPLSAAGAFQVQGAGGALVKEIEGDRNTVIGLPLAVLRDMLKEIETLTP